MRFLFVLTAALVLVSGAATAEQQCSLKQVASIPVQFNNQGAPYTTIKIQGKELNFGFDLTGNMTIVSHASIARAGLEVVTSINGTADFRDVTVGTASFPRYDMIMARDTDPHMEGLDGVLGTDFLEKYDAEFDWPDGRVNLFDQDHCLGQVVYWTHKPYARWEMTRDLSWVMILSPEIDGKTFNATVDFQTPTSINKMVAANVFGIQAGDPKLKPADGALGYKAFTYPFKTLTLDGMTVQNPQILVLENENGTTTYDNAVNVAVNIGPSILRRLRFYVAYKEHAVYVTGATAH